MNKVVYYPLRHENPYVSIVTGAIGKAGYELYGLEDLKGNHKLAKEIKAINLNWFDSIGNVPAWKAVALLIRQMLRVKYYKWCGMKVIYTMHNRESHDTKYRRINRYLMKFLCKQADYIVVLCTYSKEILKDFLSGEEIEKKVHVMYHPSYEGSYIDSHTVIPELSSDPNKMHILFMGSVRPYKNIELILDSAEGFQGKNIEFVIAGKPISSEYENMIQARVSALSNINFIPRFINDEEMTSFYQWADVVLIPLSIKSSLNSGSSILAFTMGKTIIAPKVGTLRDFPEDLVFSYEYGNEDEHFLVLVDKINEAYTKWANEPDSVKNMGLDIQKYLNEHFSKEKTEERYKEFYREVIGE